MLLTLAVALRPLVACASALLGHEYVFGVVEAPVGAVDDTVDDSRLEVDQHRPGDIVVIVCLVEEDILAVIARVTGCCALHQHAFGVDPVLLAQLLPELEPDWSTCYFGCRIGPPGW